MGHCLIDFEMLSVRTIKDAAEILLLFSDRMKYGIASQIIRTDTFRHPCSMSSALFGQDSHMGLNTRNDRMVQMANFISFNIAQLTV